MNEKKIYGTYLGQSGFLIEHPDVTLLFDCTEPEKLKLSYDKPLRIFISHIHADHFKSAVLYMASSHPDAEVYLGYDHSVDSFNRMIKEMPYALTEKIHFFDGEQSLKANAASYTLEISTLRSTDLGVAFLICLDGKTYFHAGDLFLMQTITQEKYQKLTEETLAQHPGAKVQTYEDYLEDCDREFRLYTERLSGVSIDYAMLPLDPRYDDVGYKTVRRYMNVAQIKRWSPMHLWGNYEFVDQFLEERPRYASNMIGPSKRNDVLLKIRIWEKYEIFGKGTRAETKEQTFKTFRVTVTRKKKFAGALMPYWIITGIRKEEFAAKYHIQGDLCQNDRYGRPVPRITIENLDKEGIRIENGKSREIICSEKKPTIFVSTMDGSFSN